MSIIGLLEPGHELEQDVKPVDEKLEQVREKRQPVVDSLDRLKTIIDSQHPAPSMTALRPQQTDLG